MRARLRNHYEAVVHAALKTEFGYGNDLAVPKLEKIVINMGVGETTSRYTQDPGCGLRTARRFRARSR